MSQPKQPAPRSDLPRTVQTARRSWLPRITALVLTPILAFGLLELSLQLAGFGYPTGFLLPSVQGTNSVLVQNNQFTRRFLGLKLGRLPTTLSIPMPKSPETVRVFVLGESAAMGDPMPPFGLPRMLQALFSLRYPDVRFEFENTAVTAINSHAILPIARDCARAGGDIWVVYMGNNEVVGPFGAGTVFGPQSPPLPLIRASLEFKTTRVGQCLDALRESLSGSSRHNQEWAGMQMFLKQQVPADDPRMKSVYNHFSRNLEDILQAGRKAGVGVVLSTVAVNLSDCAPFGSAHRPGMSPDEAARWNRSYQDGITNQDAGHLAAAAADFKEAASIDGVFADLRFRQGQCALGLGNLPDAETYFRSARDLDTLRFRCDTRLNELIRQAAGTNQANPVRLADAERIFAENSPAGAPGNKLFYEHVHLTFEGNYLLARIIGVQLETLLPDRIRSRNDSSASWPSLRDCARRLAWTDTSRAEAYQDILGRVKEAPFTGQSTHAAHVQYLYAALDQLLPAVQPAGVQAALNACQTAAAANPEDPVLAAQLAFFQRMTGDLPGAEASVRRALDRMPNDAASWSQLALILVQQHRPKESIDAFDRALALNPRDAGVLQDRAVARGMLNQLDEAERGYRRVLEIQPNFCMASVGLGHILEAKGQRAKAENCYRRALEPPVDPVEVASLARFCQSRGWLEAAATNYATALQLEPLDLRVRLGAGQTFAALKLFPAAAEQFRVATRLSPDSGEYWYLYGRALISAGNPTQAVDSLETAVRLMPDFAPARLNLAVSLMKSGHDTEALSQFEQVLQRDPTNNMASLYAAALRKETPATNTPPKP